MDPSGLALDESSGRLYVVDENRVQVFDVSNSPAQMPAFIYTFGEKGKGDAQLDCPWQVAVSNNRIFISDVGNSRISEWTARADGATFRRSIIGPAARNNDQNIGREVAISKDGSTLYVTTEKRNILVWSLREDEPQFQYAIGSNVTSTEDRKREIGAPDAMAQSENGKWLFVADAAFHRIHVLRA